MAYASWWSLAGGVEHTAAASLAVTATLSTDAAREQPAAAALAVTADLSPAPVSTQVAAAALAVTATLSPAGRVLWTNSLEGGTDGTAVTTGNSGGASGKAFSFVTPSTGGTIAYAALDALAGALCAQLTQPTAANQPVVVGWTAAANATSFAARYYVRLTGYPDAILDAIQIRTIAGANSCSVTISPTGQVGLRNNAGTTYGATTAVMALNTWYRIEVQGSSLGSAGATVLAVQLYEGHSTTPVETVSTSAATTTNLAGMVRFGRSSVANLATWKQDDHAVEFGDSTPIGPSGTVPVTATASLAVTATLTAAAVTTQVAAAAVAVTASLTPAAVTTQPAAASLAVTATLSPTAVTTQPATAALAVTATLSVTAGATLATTSLAVTAALSPAAVSTQLAAATLAATATVTAAAALTAAAAASLAVTAALTAAAARTANVAGQLAVTATLSPAGVSTQLAAMSLAVTATLTAVGAVGTVVTLTVTATLSASAVRAQVSGASLPVVATLTVTPGPMTRAATAALAVTAALTPGVSLVATGAAALAAVAALLASADVQQAFVFGRLTASSGPLSGTSSATRPAAVLTATSARGGPS